MAATTYLFWDRLGDLFDDGESDIAVTDRSARLRAREEPDRHDPRIECPKGTEFRYARRGEKEQWCETPDGRRQGPWVEWAGWSRFSGYFLTQRGHYVDGKLHGSQEVVVSGWLASRELYKDGELHGTSTMWHRNERTARTRPYIGGLPHGLASQWSTEGRLLGIYEMRMGTGTETTWHENGRKRTEGARTGGKQEGTWRQWSLEGVLLGEYEMHDGTGVVVTWYDDGTKESEKQYRDGVEHGVSRTWRENGRNRSEAHYEKGKRHGLEVRWDRGGNKKSEKPYRDGLLHGVVRTWNRRGKVTSTRYENGVVVHEPVRDLSNGESALDIRNGGSRDTTDTRSDSRPP